MSVSPKAAVIGGGPAGLMAAEVLARDGVAVTVYDRMPSVGRKFLMAGRGGLSLTHSEALPQFLALRRYRCAVARRDRALSGLTTCGPGAKVSASRPSPARAAASSRSRSRNSPLLRAWLRQLSEAGVVFFATSGRAGTPAASSCSRRPTETLLPARTRRSLRSAVRAGQLGSGRRLVDTGGRWHCASGPRQCRRGDQVVGHLPALRRPARSSASR